MCNAEHLGDDPHRKLLHGPLILDVFPMDVTQGENQGYRLVEQKKFSTPRSEKEIMVPSPGTTDGRLMREFFTAWAWAISSIRFCDTMAALEPWDRFPASRASMSALFLFPG